jgi:hypothetical protein
MISLCPPHRLTAADTPSSASVDTTQKSAKPDGTADSSQGLPLMIEALAHQ